MILFIGLFFYLFPVTTAIIFSHKLAHYKKEVVFVPFIYLCSRPGFTKPHTAYRGLLCFSRAGLKLLWNPVHLNWSFSS